MSPHPRFVGIRAGDHRKITSFSSEAVKSLRIFAVMCFHPTPPGWVSVREASVSISDPFIGMGVNFANVTATINLYRVRLPRSVSLILTVNTVIQMQRKVVVSQRLIVVLAIGNRQA